MLNIFVNHKTTQETTYIHTFMNTNVQTNSEERILQAAEELFLTKGYDSTKTTQIAEKAGVTHAMLHYYFRTKDKLFERIVNEKMEFVLTMVALPLANGANSFKERIQQCVETHFDFLVNNPTLPRFILNEVITNQERCEMMLQKMKPLIGVMAANLQNEANRAAEQGEIEPIDVKMLMLDILSLNVMTFVAFPVFDNIFPNTSDDLKNTFLQARKAENVTLIMKRIQKI